MSAVSLRRLVSKETLLRFVWFSLVPVLAAAAVWRWLWPAPGSFEQIDGLYVAVGSFVLFALLVRYWRPYLPGAELLATAPPESGSAKRAGALKNAAAIGLWVGGAALLAFALRSVVEIGQVTSASMLPTLQRGDKFLLNKQAYGSALPRRGDVVVFHKLIDGENVELVKRVVALPGDRVMINGNLPVINGKHLPVCHAGRYAYLSHDAALDAKVMVEFQEAGPHLAAYSPFATRFEQEYTVKPGEVFVLGDSRENSADSRTWGAGIPIASIVGRVDRLLIGAHLERDGMLRPLGTSFDLPAAVDSRLLEEGIARCLRGEGVIRPQSPEMASAAGSDQ